MELKHENEEEEESDDSEDNESLISPEEELDIIGDVLLDVVSDLNEENDTDDNNDGNNGEEDLTSCRDMLNNYDRVWGAFKEKASAICNSADRYRSTSFYKSFNKSVQEKMNEFQGEENEAEESAWNCRKHQLLTFIKENMEGIDEKLEETQGDDDDDDGTQ